MPIEIVELLEKINIKKEQRQRMLFAQGAAPLDPERLIKTAAVCQSGQRIFHGRPPEKFGRPPLFQDCPHGMHVESELSRIGFIVHRLLVRDSGDSDNTVVIKNRHAQIAQDRHMP